MELLDKTSMRTRVYNIIKERIMTQTYKFGEQIRIQPLCKELGVSNTPVREALALLEMEGLVSSSLNYRVKVVEMSPQLGTEMDQTLLVLISGAYHLCTAHRITDKLILPMEKALKCQEEALTGDIHEAVGAAMQFDRCFVDVIDNKKLLRTFDEQYDLFYLMTCCNYDKAERTREESLRQHKMIYEAVKEHRHEDVYQLLSLHYSLPVH